jgi:hypothetical protein
MSELSQEARALIDSVSKLDDPSAEDRARVKQRLALQLGAAAFTAAAVTQVAGGAGSGWFASAKAGLWGTAGKLALCAGVLGGAVAIGWPDGQPERRRTPPPQHSAPPSSAAPERTAAAQAPAAPSETPEIGVQAPDPSAAAPAAPSAVKPSAVKRTAAAGKKAQAPAPRAANEPSPLALELALLADAQAALRDGQPERALALAAQHRERFPAGVLREERLGIEVLSECDLGRKDPAHGAAFLRAAPDSPLATRVRKACGLE